MGATFSYDEGKLTELILYVAGKCDLESTYGGVKLNKILFFSDFEAYETLGRPITGAEYRKYDHGPAPSTMKALKYRLERTGDVYEYLNPLPSGFKQKRLLPLRAPDMSKFTAEEIAIVDSVITRLAGMTGPEVSRLSHEHPGWRLTDLSEPIPYFTAHIAEPNGVELSDEEQAWAREVAARVRAPRDRESVG